MKHIEDRQAVHELVDVVLDAMDELDNEEYSLVLDLANYGWSVRAGKDDEEDWRFYVNRTSLDPIEPNSINYVKQSLEKITDASPHD